MNLLKVVPVAVCVTIVFLLLSGGALGPTEKAVGGSGVSGTPPRSAHAGGSGLSTNSALAKSAISASCVVKTNPTEAAYDPVNHYVYVSTLAGYVVVLNDTLTGGACHVKTNIKLPSGAGPEGVAFDPSDGQVYVVDYNLNQVYILNGTKLKDTITNANCAASFTGCHFDDPWGIAYDEDDGFMYVTNEGDGTLTALAPSYSYTLDFSFSIGGSQPMGIAYSPFMDAMMVAEFGSDELTVIPGYQSYTPSVSYVPVGTSPIGVAFDPYIAGFLANSGTAFVTDYSTNNVTVTCAICSGGTTSVGVGSDPMGVAFDSANLRMYVADYASHSVSVIGGFYGYVLKTIKLPVGAFPSGLTYDAYTNEVYVVAEGTNTVYAVS
jgi:DNA-binding beta-propeller fold protein YncE